VASFNKVIGWWELLVPAFMERAAPVVDATIAALARKRFIEDPVAGAKYSRATSIISSAYKRHGKILETKIRKGLRDGNRHRVWSEDNFRISTAANPSCTHWSAYHRWAKEQSRRRKEVST